MTGTPAAAARVTGAGEADRPHDHTEHVDILVIGWGKGGKTLAGTAARRGLRVAMIEQSRGMIGGTCINVACVPTKILVHDAEARREDDDPDDSFDAAVERRDSLTAAMRKKNHSMSRTSIPSCWSPGTRSSPARGR